MNTIHINVWLYGPLARYGGSNDDIFANPLVELSAGATVRDLLNTLNLPTEERGISFINNNLSAMPGLQPDLDHVLSDGDRIAFFHLKSMWPCQYRSGAMMLPELATSLDERPDRGIRSQFVECDH